MSKKLFLFFFILVVVLLTLFVVSRLNHTPLLNPFAGEWDDHSSWVKNRLGPPPIFDFSTVKELPTLSSVPRYMVYNTSNFHIYYAKNAQTLFSPASFTKLLSTQIALDLVPDTTQLLTATIDSVNKVPTVLGLKPGEKLSVSDLLRGAIATSANDAAQTLAQGVADYKKIPLSNFIYLMNKKAQYLGMKNSQFANPDGLDDPAQFSTLEDIAILVNNVQKNYPEIASAGASDRQDILADTNHGPYYLPNWNGLLGVYPGVNGLKIAYTENAGYSTIVTAQYQGQSLVVIVSGTSSILERDRAAADLLDAALITEKISPVKITKNRLNLHYKEWGDLARQIKKELEEIEKAKSNVLY